LCGYDIFSISINKSFLLEKTSNETYYLKKFSQDSLKKTLLKLDPRCKKKVLLGSGIIEKLSDYSLISGRSNFGNDEKTHKLLVNPKKLFKTLNTIDVSYPKSITRITNNKYSWLKKNISSYGGTKVSYVEDIDTKISDPKEYFQKFINGEVISVQFLVKQKRIIFHSICSQWNHKIKDKPFILGGLINRNTSKELEKKLFKIVKKICLSFKLKGLNSIDFILPKNNCNPQFLEINSRPGLTINLLSKIYKNNLLNIDQKYIRTKNKYATAIIYSKKDFLLKSKQKLRLLELSKKYDITELPYNKKKFLKHEPFCLIHSQSSSEHKTKQIIKELSNKVIKLM
jgi:predicted ATP-grasp superfamily ATP-dependent carboligase